MKVPINHNSIEIVQGDITDERTDVIVNAANNHLWMGAGVAGSIKRKGGEIIEQEAVVQGPVNVGEAVLTSGGKLPVRFVIHAAVMGQDLHTNADIIAKAMQSALELAERKNFASISFPALGTGVGGFSVFHCAKVMITRSVEFLMNSRSIHLIRLVLFDESTFSAFESELKIQFSSKRH
jgi:O-acetyl-ADP-ribose deacetylase (regulator of RNase III)